MSADASLITALLAASASLQRRTPSSARRVGVRLGPRQARRTAPPPPHNAERNRRSLLTPSAGSVADTIHESWAGLPETDRYGTPAHFILGRRLKCRSERSHLGSRWMAPCHRTRDGHGSRPESSSGGDTAGGVSREASCMIMLSLQYRVLLYAGSSVDSSS